MESLEFNDSLHISHNCLGFISNAVYPNNIVSKSNCKCYFCIIINLEMLTEHFGINKIFYLKESTFASLFLVFLR